MVQSFNIIRENKEYTVNIGITEDKESVLYLQYNTPESEFNSYERWSFDSLFIDTDKTKTVGSVSLIRTTWRKNQVSINGVSMEGNQIMEVMMTKAEDIKTFLNLLTVSMPILMFMTNGLVRDIWGHNHLPVFNADGTVKEVTTYLESIPPTNDYRTWNTGDDLPEILTEPEVGE